MEIGAPRMYHDGIARALWFGHGVRACRTLPDLEKSRRTLVGLILDYQDGGLRLRQLLVTSSEFARSGYPTCPRNLTVTCPRVPGVEPGVCTSTKVDGEEAHMLGDVRIGCRSDIIAFRSLCSELWRFTPVQRVWLPQLRGSKNFLRYIGRGVVLECIVHERHFSSYSLIGSHGCLGP